MDLAPSSPRPTPAEVVAMRAAILAAMKASGGKVRAAVVSIFGPYADTEQGAREYAADRRRLDRRVQALGLRAELTKLYPKGKRESRVGDGGGRTVRLPSIAALEPQMEIGSMARSKEWDVEWGNGLGDEHRVKATTAEEAAKKVAKSRYYASGGGMGRVTVKYVTEPEPKGVNAVYEVRCGGVLQPRRLFVRS